MRDRPGLAVLLSAVSALSFAGMSACLKASLHGGATLGHAVFFRTAVTFVLASLMALALRASPRGLPVKVLLTRTLLGGSAMVLGFYAVGHLPLGDAEVLRRTSPLFVVVLAWPVLGERPGGPLVGLVLAALLGAALVARPTFDVTWVPATAALLAGALGAGAYLCIRHMAKGTPVTLMVAFFTGIMALGSAPFALARPLPDAGLLVPLLGAGAAGTLGQLFMTAGYRFAPAGIVATVGYLAVVFATLFGALFFSHLPDALSMFGAALIAGSCVLISLLRGGVPGGPAAVDASPPRAETRV